jgi:16S rRNA (cytosine1402-N4)-methyltransferase
MVDSRLANKVDRDDMAIKHLQALKKQGAHLVHTDFVSAAESLTKKQQQFDVILADLGVSSPQLDIAERGFSFLSDSPLDMRMDRRQENTADNLVNKTSPKLLTQIIHDYGEEPLGRARRIANAIAEARPINTTQELATVIAKNYRGQSKIHPATRTFQALRIALNQELEQVNKLLPLIPGLLKPGGRIAIISFHSLEDRLVKQYFKSQQTAGYEAELDIITKKPISGATEDVHNPRARSAKLRAAVKINT